VSESSAFYPPSLSPVVYRHHRQRGLAVQALLSGSSWTSDRCETRPHGVFLLRRMTFGWNAGQLLRAGADGDGAWKEQFDYYDDPLCRSPSFTVHAAGRYVVAGDADAFEDPGRIVEVDFSVQRVSVVVWKPRLLENVRTGSSECGDDGALWEVSSQRLIDL